MKALYESEFATIHCGDAREYVEHAERVSVDLIVTDPPYGGSYRSNWQVHEVMAGDESKQAVFGYSADELSSPMKLGSSTELIWSKVNHIGMGDLKQPWGASHERITFGAYYTNASNRLDGRGSLSARLRKGSILTVPRLNRTRHPTEKPVELMRQLIESSSCIGEVVLDPFAGSGSTLVAAIVSGRRCVGVEIDEKYARIAVQRAKAAERVYGQIAAL